ncbi:ASCH domain-containing protein [Microbacterium lushaniae]|uniref:ASCH domain-containing protein n=2 Tax=Microbacterium lushaniae TaxID=2614639 RepID=A0A5J6L1F4_9MICO|nr:ASCH domain-containing protein [Microbacterium lushaniae]QEW02333.1 ASCH domain-containing protein [Microbacterium lushaniae]
MGSMEPVDLTAAAEMWKAYQSAHPDLATDNEMPSVERFGDHPALSDELLGLVIDGEKRATATLLKEFEAEGQQLPRIGSHWIACDGAGRPRAILRSTELRIGTIDTADAAFAYDEAEDDRSLDAWLLGHRTYWNRICPSLGIEWSDDLEILFERFTVAWTA